MQVDELMSYPVRTLSPEATCLEAAQLMGEARVGSIVVSDGGPPLGIITDRDLIVRVMAEDRPPRAVAVREVMSRAPIFAHAGRDASDVLDFMREQGVRRLPVVDDRQEIIGMITLDDLIQAVAADVTAIAETIRKEL